MNSSAIADQLEKLIQEGDNIDYEAQIDRWANRVRAFLAATLGEQYASDFDKHSTSSGNLYDLHACRLGQIQGLLVEVSQEQSATNPNSSGERRSQANKVFLVHGHDGEAKSKVARFLEQLGLNIIILHEQANSGLTIIEKFEVHSQDIAFAVVLLTPDDVGASKGKENELNPRARQNVILEFGFFLGRLGRLRVCSLYKKGVELPSDIQGVLYIELDESDAWKTKLAQELVAAGLTIELKALIGS